MCNIKKRMAIIGVIVSVVIGIFLNPIKIYAAENEDNIDTLSEDKSTKVQKFIEETMEKAKIPGLSVTIVKDDKTIYKKGFGYADLENKEPVTPESVFELASNTKAYTALGILKLSEDGLINLEDNVTKYIPWLKPKYKDKEVQITIEQLIHHTSGIPDLTLEMDLNNKDLNEVAKQIADTDLLSEPGEKYNYTTTNYSILGLVIEKVTNKSYEDYMDEDVLKPLGLNNTYVDKQQVSEKLMTKGYKISFLKPREYYAPECRGDKPGAYFLSNADDMAKWLKIQMGTSNSSNALQELIKASHEPKNKIPAEQDGTYYAAGWFSSNDGEEIYHDGNNASYSSMICFNTKEKIGVAVLCNSDSLYTTEMGKGIKEIVEGNDYTIRTADFYQFLDISSIIIIIITALISFKAVYSVVKISKQIYLKERVLSLGCGKIIITIICLLLAIGLSYAIYCSSSILFGYSWRQAFIFISKAVEVAYYLLYTAIWLLFIHIMLANLFKKI